MMRLRKLGLPIGAALFAVLVLAVAGSFADDPKPTDEKSESAQPESWNDYSGEEAPSAETQPATDKGDDAEAATSRPKNGNFNGYPVDPENPMTAYPLPRFQTQQNFPPPSGGKPPYIPSGGKPSYIPSGGKPGYYPRPRPQSQQSGMPGQMNPDLLRWVYKMLMNQRNQNSGAVRWGGAASAGTSLQ